MSQPSYFKLGATALRTDTKYVRWARRLGAFQDATAGDSRYNPRRTDTQYGILNKLASSVNGKRVSIRVGVRFGQGKPVSAPYGRRKVYVQKDSTPPFRAWVYYNGVWI